MKTIINGWPLLSPHTGIGSYVKNLGLALKNIEDIDAQFFYGSHISSNIRMNPVPGINKLKSFVKNNIPNPYACMRTIQQAQFSCATMFNRFDLYHDPSFKPLHFNGPTVTTVHDLSPLHYPETHPKDRVKDFTTHLPKSLTQAQRIIVDSTFIRNEIIKEFGHEEKIDVIPLGVDASFHPRQEDEIQETLNKFGLSYKKYILAVGTIEPRKNMITAMKSYKELPPLLRKEYPLVIIGMRGWENTAFDQNIKNIDMDGIFMPGFISQNDLLQLYAGAALFVYPSLYEGFGLPVLEAMASGVPVITSDCASLPEVAGDAALLIDPHNIDHLSENMRKCIEDKPFSANLVEKGIKNAARFTWNECALNTVKTYKKAIQ